MLPPTTGDATNGTVVRMRAMVRGRVQGVGFRDWTTRTAQQLNVSGGQARNLPDGNVEVIAEARERATLEALSAALHRGPNAAHVEAVETSWEENAEPRFVSFRVADR